MERGQSMTSKKRQGQASGEQKGGGRELIFQSTKIRFITLDKKRRPSTLDWSLHGQRVAEKSFRGKLRLTTLSWGMQIFIEGSSLWRAIGAEKLGNDRKINRSGGCNMLMDVMILFLDKKNSKVYKKSRRGFCIFKSI